MIPSRKWLIPLGGVALIGVLVILGSGRRTQPQYFTAKVERGDLHDAVEATGTVNAVVTVQVGSQVSGTILRLKADFNTRVRKGDVIAEIEPSVFQGALLQASADLESARANVEVAQANLEKAKATLVQTKADYERNERLAKGEMISPQQLEAARAAYDEATASVGAAQAGVTQARAMVSQKTAAVAVSRTNLDHTVIRSPIDGIVVARSVDVGQTVAASLQAPTIFTIAQDLTKMRVYAKTDESDVGSIRAGQPVSFKVDAFPKDRFQGVVSQVRMNATVVQNVVTYDTVIEFENKDLKLFPGMTAYVTIPVASAQNVLKVPNGALRYRPSLGAEEIRALYLKYGIDAESQGAAPSADQAVVWRLLPDKSLEPVAVGLGITDHTYTEVARIRKGELKEGEEVVTGSVTARPQNPGAQGIRR
jgi:HlyD family secretion protein